MNVASLSRCFITIAACVAAISWMAPDPAQAECTNVACQQTMNTPWCDPVAGSCVQCVGNAHCISNGWTGAGGQFKVVCTNNNVCVVCTADYQCGADYCKNNGTHLAQCVNCLSDNHCTNRFHPICQADGSCEACSPGPAGDDECFAKAPEMPRCWGGECVECVDDDDCGQDELCDGNSCSPTSWPPE